MFLRKSESATKFPHECFWILCKYFVVFSTSKQENYCEQLCVKCFIRYTYSSGSFIFPNFVLIIINIYNLTEASPQTYAKFRINSYKCNLIKLNNIVNNTALLILFYYRVTIFCDDLSELLICSSVRLSVNIRYVFFIFVIK